MSSVFSLSSLMQQRNSMSHTFWERDTHADICSQVSSLIHVFWGSKCVAQNSCQLLLHRECRLRDQHQVEVLQVINHSYFTFLGSQDRFLSSINLYISTSSPALLFHPLQQQKKNDTAVSFLFHRQKLSQTTAIRNENSVLTPKFRRFFTLKK